MSSEPEVIHAVEQEDTLSNEKAPSMIDVHVGLRLRTLRKARGVTQEALAKGIGVTFQQVQKYEKGTNRVSASTLFASAQVLGVNVSDFYEGLSQPDGAQAVDSELYQALTTDPSLSRAIKALSRLRHARKRQLAFQMIEVLANDP